jgi:hypothetical protein
VTEPASAPIEMLCPKCRSVVQGHGDSGFGPEFSCECGTLWTGDPSYDDIEQARRARRAQAGEAP